MISNFHVGFKEIDIAQRCLFLGSQPEMTPLLAVKKLVKIPFQDFCHLDDRAARSENTSVFKLFTAGCDSI